MPASLDHIHPGTPMGANLIAAGAIFRVWAPQARAVYAIGDFNHRVRNDASLLTRDEFGHWRGFIPGVRDRERYMFYVVGEGSEGLEARSLCPRAGDALSQRLHRPQVRLSLARERVRHAALSRFRPLSAPRRHVFTPNLPHKGGTFLDVARKLPYLAELGRHGPAAPAHPGIPHQLQPRLQRHRLFFARDGFRRGGCRPASLRRQGERAPGREGSAPLPDGGSARRNESTQGAGGSLLISTAWPLSSTWFTTMRAASSATRAFTFSTANRPPAGRGIPSISLTRAMPAASSSISPNRRCAISSSRTPDSFSTNTASTDFATIR